MTKTLQIWGFYTVSAASTGSVGNIRPWNLGGRMSVASFQESCVFAVERFVAKQVFLKCGIKSIRMDASFKQGLADFAFIPQLVGFLRVLWRSFAFPDDWTERLPAVNLPCKPSRGAGRAEPAQPVLGSVPQQGQGGEALQWGASWQWQDHCSLLLKHLQGISLQCFHTGTAQGTGLTGLSFQPVKLRLLGDKEGSNSFSTWSWGSGWLLCCAWVAFVWC